MSEVISYLLGALITSCLLAGGVVLANRCAAYCRTPLKKSISYIYRFLLTATGVPYLIRLYYIYQLKYDLGDIVIIKYHKTIYTIVKCFNPKDKHYAIAKLVPTSNFNLYTAYEHELEPTTLDLAGLPNSVRSNIVRTLLKLKDTK